MKFEYYSTVANLFFVFNGSYIENLRENKARFKFLIVLFFNSRATVTCIDFIGIRNSEIFINISGHGIGSPK